MIDQIPPAFFHRSPELTSLELDRVFLVPSNILDVLEAQHGLTHLSLTCKHGIGPSGKLTHDRDTFDLESLVVQANTNVDDEPPYRELLPRLEVFELHRTLVSDDLVLRFVDSRMDPSSHIAVLKKVSMRFDRFKEQENLDLAHEIGVRANAAGIQVETHFSYPLSTLEAQKRNNFMSPSYVPSRGRLSSSKDVTWKQQDYIDEYDD